MVDVFEVFQSATDARIQEMPLYPDNPLDARADAGTLPAPTGLGLEGQVVGYKSLICRRRRSEHREPEEIS